MSGLEAFGAVAAAIQLSTSFIGHLNTIRNAPKERRRLFEEVVSLMSILNAVRDTLDQDEKQNAAIETQLKTPLANFSQRLELMEEKLLRKSRLRDLGWPIERSEAEASLQAIERVKTTCAFVLGYSNRLLTKEANEKIRGVDEKISPMVADAAEAKRREMLDWIWPPDFHHKQQDNRNKRHPGTGSAFLSNPKLLEWIEGPSNILACVGGPGVGKTLLVSILYDHLRDKYSSLDTAVVAVYLDFNQPDHQSWTALSANFVRQMAELGTGPSGDLIEKYQSKSANGLKATEDDYKAFLMSQMSSFARVFVLVDALDEANDASRALLLKEMAGLQKRWPKIKFLSTSRWWHCIPNATRLDVDTDEEDMRKFLGKELEKNDHWVRERSLPKEFIDNMLNAIVKAAQKIFLMIRLSLEALFESQTRREVQRTLAKLPDTMDKAYGDVINRIQRDRNKNRAFETLTWLLYAFEPISANGVRHALAVDLEDKAFFEDDLVPETLLLSSCKGLVAIGQRGGLLHLSHETVHKYLRKHEHKLFSNCHTLLAEKCLIYLSHGKVPHKLKGEGTSFFEYASRNWGSHVRMAGSDSHLSKTVDAFISDHTKLSRSVKCIDLLQYRAAYHPVHILAHFDLQEIFEDQIRIDQSRELLKDSHERTTLFFAAEANSLEIVELLLNRGVVDVNLADRRGLTPLLIALRHGYTEVAKAIIQHPQIDLERFDTRGFTPLHEAVVRKNHEILRLLLSKGANIGAETGSGRTALGLAMQDTTDWPFQNGKPIGDATSLKKSILANLVVGTDITTINQYAILADATKIMTRNDVLEALLTRGADVCFRDRHGSTALHWAAKTGNWKATKLLLQHNADPNAPDLDGMTPLHLACKNGSAADVQQLACVMTDLNSLAIHNGRGVTALYLAEQNGFQHIAGYLRKRNAESIAQAGIVAKPEVDRTVSAASAKLEDRRRANEFILAARKNDIDKMRKMRKQGIDIESRHSEDESTALHNAAYYGLVDLLRWLLSFGANVNSRDFLGRTPLFEACTTNELRAVDVLLDHGADPDVLDNNATRPFDATSNEKIRRLLRERSAIRYDLECLSDLHKAVRDEDVNAVGRIVECGDHANQMTFDGDGNTPLHYAAINNLDRIVSKMVIMGIDVDQTNRYGQTALDATVFRRAFHQAESETSRRIVEMLGWPSFRRDGGLNFVHRIGPQWNKIPLHWAAERGKLAQVELLLAWGSDPNRPDEFGETPLHYAAENGFIEVTKRLIPVTEVRKLDKQGFTPLRKARERNRAATVRLMLPFWTEADVRATDAQKKSFKDWAIELKLYDAEAKVWVNLPCGMEEPPVLD